MYRLLTIILCFFLSGCVDKMDYANSPNFNVQKKRFQHPAGDPSDKTVADLFKMVREFSNRASDQSERQGFPVTYSDQATLSAFSESVIWIGQSSILLNHSGVTILTDPHFSGRASPVGFAGPKRVTPAPFEISDLPVVDVVLISHNHYDHLDRTSIVDLIAYQPSIKFFVPLGLAKTLRRWGAKDVTELDWWQAVILDGMEIQPTPVQHWSKRSFFDRNKSLWAGWMVKWSDFSFYFAGDSGYSDDFKETSKRLGGPTLAAIPIGAYEPRDFMKAAHMNPEEAVQTFVDLGAKYAVAIHWGTFKLTTEQMDEPTVRLRKSLTNNDIALHRFRALQHGEKWRTPIRDK
jgi:L-ascorbate metabolism protein UlaG (beta-lactamase superfamily)